MRVALENFLTTHIINQPVVWTDKGGWRGIISEDAENVEIFRGIPFAAPPTEALRFRKPQEAQNREKINSAQATPKSCLQARVFRFPYFL